MESRDVTLDVFKSSKSFTALSMFNDADAERTASRPRLFITKTGSSQVGLNFRSESSSEFPLPPKAKLSQPNQLREEDRFDVSCLSAIRSVIVNNAMERGEGTEYEA